jgi:hypothetical protein
MNRGKALLAVLAFAVWSGASPVSPAGVVIPDAALRGKRGIVAVHVNDRYGNHIVSATGSIIDSRGIVATSCYVIPKWLEKVENTLVVEMESGALSPIENLISRNCGNNVALIQVKGNALPTVDLAPAGVPARGEDVAVVTMTPRPAVAEGRIRDVARNTGIIQTSVPVNPARDGSPVLNRRGEVIGVATFLPSKKQNLPAVIPAKNVAKEFSKYRSLIHELSLSNSPPGPAPPAPDGIRISGPEPAAFTKERREGRRDTAESAFLAGCSHDRAQQYREAIEAYTRAVSLKSDYGEAYANLGLSYFRVEKYAEAVEAYKQAIKINPSVPSLYNKLGATYIILGEYSKALEAFRKGLGLDPKNPEVHFNLGVAYVLTGDKNGAVDEYTVLKELDRKSAEKLLNLMY